MRRLARMLMLVLGLDMGMSWPNGLRLPHPYGVVIHAEAEIGSNCVIYQNVTIGSSGKGFGTPILGHCVTVYPGAVIVGGVSIGDHSTIGANAVVRTDVPAFSTAVGVPARIISQASNNREAP